MSSPEKVSTVICVVANCSPNIPFMDCYRNFWVHSLNVERDQKSVSASREILSSGDDGKCHEYLRMKSTRVRFYSQNCSSRPLE